MKSLVVFYSWSGNTKKLAREISGVLRCDAEEIQDVKPRKGLWSFFISGMEAVLKKCPPIKEPHFNPEDYDTVILGTPVWGSTISSPVRSYLRQKAGSIKKVALFCVSGIAGQKSVAREVEKICGLAPLAFLNLTEKDLRSEEYKIKLKEFLGKLS